MKNALNSILLFIAGVFLIFQSIFVIEDHRGWVEHGKRVLEQRNEDDRQLAVALSREDLLSLCNKLVAQGDVFLADRLRDKGGLTQDPRWK